jgi:hypothetical protein
MSLLLFEVDLILFPDELHQLVLRHGENLIESIEHKAFEVFIWNRQDWRSMRLNIRVDTMEHIFAVIHTTAHHPTTRIETSSRIIESRILLPILGRHEDRLKICILMLEILGNRGCLRIKYL